MSKNPDFIVKNGVLIRYRGPGGDIQIPSGVKKIGRQAFAGCHTLTKVVLPEGVRQVGEKAFFDCAGLVWVDLPQGVKEIGPYAFGGCVSLFGLDLPQGVKKIGKGAFAGCASLTRLALPKSVKKISRSALQGCPMSAAAPYLPVNKFKKESRPQAAQQFAAARLAKIEMRRKIRAGYMNYIRSRRRCLYPAAIESEELLWLMLKEKMAPRKELQLLLEEAEAQQNMAAKAAILAYGRHYFKDRKNQKRGRETE